MPLLDRWTASARAADPDEDPFRILRLAVALLLAGGTVVTLILWLTGIAPRAWLLFGALWTLYGLCFGVIDGVLEPLIEFGGSLLANVGLDRTGAGYSAIETMVTRGHYDAAADEYLTRARANTGDPEAMLRRAALLAGPLQTPEQAVAELENFRDTLPLSARDDIRVGLALVRLAEGPLAEPGRAMAELRRLLDRHPSDRAMRQIRTHLTELREERFGP